MQASEIKEFAEKAGFAVEEAEVTEYGKILDHMLGLLAEFERRSASVSEEPANVTAVRDTGSLAIRDQDPLNAVIRWCSVKSNSHGPVDGLRFGMKDNIPIAGIPMTAGSRVLHNYVPEHDATVVSRLINAGGEIVATLNLEAFAWSGGGETSSFGPILNPFDQSRTASGSSGGSAAALYYDRIDVTLGTDQGGSIRLPASWCGVLGLKPSRGCIPYTGALSIEQSCDYIGPLSRSVVDMASTMDVIAGEDGWDPRQAGVEQPTGFRKAVDEAPNTLEGVVIGILREGFAFEETPHPRSGTIETAEAVRASLKEFERLGARLVDVSVPMHEAAGFLLFPTLAEAQNSLLHGFGNAYHAGGRYSPDLALALGRNLEERADALPATIKFVAILGGYLQERHYGWHYAVAKNSIPRLAEAYDEAFRDVDFLVMPTTSHYAHKAKPEATISEQVLRGITMVANTGQFNLSGHPALSIPAAEADGLPVGVMFVAPRSQDARLLSLARTYEMANGWLPEWAGPTWS